MTIEMPPARVSTVTGADRRSEDGPGEVRWARALCALHAHLGELGLRSWMNGRVGAVDAALRAPGDGGGERASTQRVVLRPHRGRLWWWLRVPPECARPPFLVPLVPAAAPERAARRVRDVLASRRG